MGFEYSVINSQWSAISAYYNYVDNRIVRQQPKVSGLMPADFHVKPAKPKYVLFAMWGKFFSFFRYYSQLGGPQIEFLLKLTT